MTQEIEVGDMDVIHEGVVAELQKLGCPKCETKTSQHVNITGEELHEWCIHARCTVCGNERDIHAVKTIHIGTKIMKVFDDKVSGSSFPILKDGLIRTFSINLVKKGYESIELKVELK